MGKLHNRSMPKAKKPKYTTLNLEKDPGYNAGMLGIPSSRRTPSGHYIVDQSTIADQKHNSEFPSLGPQPQQANASQAWNTTALRTPQQAPAQRATSSQQQPVQQTQQQQQPQPPQPQQQQQQRSVSAQTHESQQPEPSSLDSQFDGQSPASGRAGSEQPQDEFPPLSNQAQLNGRVNGFSHEDGAFGSESSRPRPANPPGIEQQMGLMQQQPPIGQASAQQQPSQHSSNFAPQMVDAPITNQAVPQQLQPYEEMSEADKWGLPGLLAKIRSNDASSAFTMGVDINSLGLDLDSPEPLFATFSTPFADNRSRPVIPEFTLPGGYTVTNVPALATRMSAFSDETLFFVFYQNPRDVVQELAAGELYSRDWRWHKELQQWMMKDSQMAAPIRVSERSERGVYIFFDANNWRRERREFVLNYDHLDQRHGATQPQAAL
jgi:CCR4-NOT transcription complex subunit 2